MIPETLDNPDRVPSSSPHDMPSCTHIAAGVANQSSGPGAFLHLRPGPAASGHQPDGRVLIEQSYRGRVQGPSRSHASQSLLLRSPSKSATATTRAWMAPKDVPRIASGASSRLAEWGNQSDILDLPDITAHVDGTWCCAVVDGACSASVGPLPYLYLSWPLFCAATNSRGASCFDRFRPARSLHIIPRLASLCYRLPSFPGSRQARFGASLITLGVLSSSGLAGLHWHTQGGGPISLPTTSWRRIPCLCVWNPDCFLFVSH